MRIVQGNVMQCRNTKYGLCACNHPEKMNARALWDRERYQRWRGRERERAEGLDSLSKVRPVISKYP